MEEGTILTWLAADGAAIEIGQELLEVETDKATVTVQSEVAGVLRILVQEGSTVAVGTIIAEAGAGDTPPHDEAAGRDAAIVRDEAVARDETAHAGNGPAWPGPPPRRSPARRPPPRRRRPSRPGPATVRARLRPPPRWPGAPPASMACASRN